MATAEQRSGFRLPWASEAPAEPAPDEVVAESTEQRPESTTPEATEATTPEANVTDDASTATIDYRSTAWPTQEPSAQASDEAAGEVVSGAAAQADGSAAAPAEASATHAEPTEAIAAPDVPLPLPGRARRDNPLVAGLVRAMREAAEAARAESLARFSESAKARVDEIQTESATAGEAIRHQSDEDIAGIRDWSKAEMARVREETEERIADRKRRLEEEIEEHAALIEHRIELVQAAVRRFEDDMNRFYERLLAEEDPARLAGFAEQLPEPPALDAVADADGWMPPRTLAADDAAAAEASFLSDLGAETADEAAPGPEASATWADSSVIDIETADNDASASPTQAIKFEDEARVTEAEPIDDTVDDPHVVERLASFTDAPEDTAETTTTSLSVVGLISVASIASFKRAVARSVGVRGVSVASGPKGDFIFTVQHAATTDLRTIIPELDRFSASITSDADGVLSVSASEPGEES